MNKMLDKILNQIDVINESLKWIRNNKPEQYEPRFLQLVEERRKLRKMADAERENPAIAAYGESQVGKSYLMSNILQREGKPFLVSVNGHDYDFIEEMNPITHDTEATGVVTRFSSYARNEKLYSDVHPIMMKTLSVADIVLILCDGYYNNLVDYTSDSADEINQLAEEYYQRYIAQAEGANNAVTEDDVMDMKYYFKTYINNAQLYNQSAFFDRIALIIRRVPVSGLREIFANLWHRDAHITAHFDRLLALAEKLGFSRVVYLPVDAVLRNGHNENTIMSVQCLNGLGNDAAANTCDAYLRKDSGDFDTISQLSKSELAAICSEVVFRIGEEYLESSAAYDFTMIDDPLTVGKISHDKVKKDILRYNDLLDFPGARSPKKHMNDKLGDLSIINELYLRGKVTYLFNKYCENRELSALLYCHHQKQTEVSTLYITLNDWVGKYVGDTPERRKRTLETTGGISPLFYIATKFNIDMSEEQSDAKNERTAIDGRWEERFTKVLYTQCFNAKSVDWVRNWTAQGEGFRNSYLLRDFKYSGEKGSKLYAGFSTEGRETAPTMPDSYYRKLRTSFVESDDVGMLFADPAKSWDVAATMNNDGALYIIEQLTKVAHCMERTREHLFGTQLADTRSKVLKLLKEYHVSEDAVEILNENVRKATSILRELDFTCNEDNYYFGHLLQALQTTETECLRVVHSIVQNPETNTVVNDFKEYEIILRRIERALDEAKSDEERWRVIMDAYGFQSREEAEDYLRRRGVRPDVLFRHKETIKPKKNSNIIADRVYEMWRTSITSLDFMNDYAEATGFDAIVMGSFVDNILLTSRHVGLAQHLSDMIAEYVNVVGLQLINESLVADMLASGINEFVRDLGYSMLTDDERMHARDVAQRQKLPVFRYIGRPERKSYFEESELTELFNELTSEPKALTPAFEENYFKWEEYIYVSFIAFLSIPEYDKEANDRLTEIIGKIDH